MNAYKVTKLPNSMAGFPVNVAVAIGDYNTGFVFLEMGATNGSIRITPNQRARDITAKGHQIASLPFQRTVRDETNVRHVINLCNERKVGLMRAGHSLVIPDQFFIWKWLADMNGRVTDIKTAHVKAIEILSQISKNGMMRHNMEDHVLIYDKADKYGKYFQVGNVIPGGPEPGTLPVATMRMIAENTGIAGVCHLHFNGYWLSAGDFRSAIAHGISISAVDMRDRKAEVFIPDFGRQTDGGGRRNFAGQWDKNAREMEGPCETKDKINDNRFYYAPAGYKRYIPDGTYYDVDVK